MKSIYSLTPKVLIWSWELNKAWELSTIGTRGVTKVSAISPMHSINFDFISKSLAKQFATPKDIAQQISQEPPKHGSNNEEDLDLVNDQMNNQH